MNWFVGPRRVFFVKNLLRKSYSICCVTRQESIYAVAYSSPTRAHAAPPHETKQNKIEQGGPSYPLEPSEGAFELTHGSACIIGW